MSKLRLVSPLQSKTTSTCQPSPTDWSKCIICQTDTNEKLCCPGASCRRDAGAGYRSLAGNLRAFQEIGGLPKELNINSLCDEGCLEITFEHNAAKFHERCRLQYNKSKLQRAVKRKLFDQPENNIPTQSPEKQLCLRNRDTNKILICIFCEKPATQEDALHQTSTSELWQKLKHCATVLQDHELCRKVSGNDNDCDSRYHRKCLVNVYNLTRSKLRKQKNCDHKSAEDSYEKAFSELVSFITTKCAENRQKQISSLFKLSELVQFYKIKLQEFGTSSNNIHATRLKDKILHNFPDLQAFSNGNGHSTLLISNAELCNTFNNTLKDDIAPNQDTLVSTAKMIRNDIKSVKTQFCDTFSANCQIDCIPLSLITLVSLILYGPTTEEVTHIKNNQAILTISQLLMFNLKKRCDAPKQALRHAKEREPPLPIYLGMLLHNTTRKKKLIDKFFMLGLSISHDRVLEISTEIGNRICHFYGILNTVCPPQLKKQVFTTSAMDNINHQTSATTAKTSFNGTSISIFQHFDENQTCGGLESIGCDETYPTTTNIISQRFPELPPSYSTVEHVAHDKAYVTVPKLDEAHISQCPLVDNSIKDEQKWLKHVSVAAQSSEDIKNVSWSAFHASRCVAEEESRVRYASATSTLLPLFEEEAATISMVSHGMGVIKRAVQLTNPNQVPVMEVDQPLYSLAKTVQWKWPELYGENEFVVMFGGLHIEAAALKMIGQLLEGSGWMEALLTANVTSKGRADAILKALHIKRTRRAHEITACALFQALDNAYEKHKTTTQNCGNDKTMEQWIKEKQSSQPTFKFWYMILHLELTILCFVKSIRNGDFRLYIEALTTLTPWFFAMDHMNYARWLSVHLRDMINLHKSHASVHEAFMKGYFTVKKSKRLFSNMAIDQAHEQNNALVKDEGGAIGLTECQSALRRWTICGPEMARILNEFESACNFEYNRTSCCHHEQQPSIQRSYLIDVESLKNTVDLYGNPFLDCTGELVVLNSRDVMDSNAVEALYKVEAIGKEHYENFVQERLMDMSKNIKEPIAKNKIKLFLSAASQKKTKSKELLTGLKNDRNLFSRLYVACQVRDGNLRDFFQHENQAYPPSLSDCGRLRCSNKADIVQCLEENTNMIGTDTSYVDAEVVILDGAAVVHMTKPGYAKTFREYAQSTFLPYISKQLEKTATQRLDIVWDEYRKHSLKQQTREKRAQGIRRRVEHNNDIPNDWAGFLKDSENKKELFGYLSQETMKINTDKQVISTHQENTLCRIPRNLSGLAPCSHEEADTRIMLHIQDAAKQYQRIIVRTVDSDIVVLAVYLFSQLTSCLSHLWIAYGTGKHYRIIPAHAIYATLGPEKSSGLPMFHSFTGCDQTSSFLGRGKKRAWETWKSFPEITSVFSKLMNEPKIETVDGCMEILERFVVLLYDKNSNTHDVDEARLHLFTRKGRDINNLPPTHHALLQHAKRASYQAGHVWAQCLKPNPQLANPGDWGWKLSGDVWEVYWSSIPQASEACRTLLRCGCATKCKKNCKCKKADIRCTALCKCGGIC